MLHRTGEGPSVPIAAKRRGPEMPVDRSGRPAYRGKDLDGTGRVDDSLHDRIVYRGNQTLRPHPEDATLSRGRLEGAEGVRMATDTLGYGRRRKRAIVRQVLGRLLLRTRRFDDMAEQRHG